MYFDGLADLKAYAKEFGERQFITKGFLCCRTDDDDIIITKPNINLLKVKDSDFDEISSDTLEAPIFDTCIKFHESDLPQNITIF